MRTKVWVVCSIIAMVKLFFPVHALGEDAVGLRFTTREDFTHGTIGWNVKWTEDGIALNRAVSILKHPPILSIPRLIKYAWQDPTTGEIYIGTYNDGITVLLPDGRCFTYRTSGVWDTTEDPVGKLINPEVKLGRNTVIY
ncbi:MAG: hypothetical protein DRI61_09490, partial [Chloroflexi bacterium]